MNQGTKRTGTADRVRKTVFFPVMTEDDAMIVESLARDIWTKHYTPIIGREQVEYMLERYQSSEAILGQIGAGVLYFLIKAETGIVGYLAVQPRTDELFLSKIYVSSGERGKGYGKQAVQFAETLAKLRRLGKIVLTVNKNNVDSIRAYEKMGFKNTGALVQDIGSGFVMDDYRMEKAVPGEGA